MPYTPTNAERETTIRWDAEERVAHIYTAQPAYIRKLDNLCAEFPDDYRLVSRYEYGAKYTCPAKRIRFTKPASDAQKEAARRNTQLSSKNTRNPCVPSDSTDPDV